MNEVRRTLLDADVRVHQVLVVHQRGDDVDYHLPGGREEEANFLTVREAIGLVDYLTDGRPSEAIPY